MVNLFVESLAAGAATQPSDFLTTHFPKRLTSYKQDGAGVTLRFHDGSSAHADVLVGADGIGSPTHKTMFTKLADNVRATDPEGVELLEP